MAAIVGVVSLGTLHSQNFNNLLLFNNNQNQRYTTTTLLHHYQHYTIGASVTSAILSLPIVGSLVGAYLGIDRCLVILTAQIT